MRKKSGRKRRTGLSDGKLERIALGMGEKLSASRLMKEAGVGQPRAKAMVDMLRGREGILKEFRAAAGEVFAGIELQGAGLPPVGFQSEKAAQRAEAIGEVPEERRQDGFMDGIDEEIREEIGRVCGDPGEFDEVAETYPNPLLVRFRDAGIARKAEGDWPVGLKVPRSEILEEGGHKWVRGRPRSRSKW